MDKSVAVHNFIPEYLDNLTCAANSAKLPFVLLMVEGIRSCEPPEAPFDFFCVGSVTEASLTGAEWFGFKPYEFTEGGIESKWGREP